MSPLVEHLIKALIFILVSVWLFYLSYSSLKKVNSHGFYRFFVWELIAALFLLNINWWFIQPFAWYQILSWILLFGSLIPLYFGVRLLIQHGKPIKTRPGEEQLYGFEKTTQLVTTGLYHYIRHPLYASLLYLTWGIMLKHPTAAAAIFAAAASIFLFLTARADEAECLRFFGQNYADYMKVSKRFIPFVF